MRITTGKMSFHYEAQVYQSPFLLKVTPFFAIFAEIPARFVIHFRLLTITMWLSIGLFSILIFNIMAKSQATFMKKQLEKNRQKKKEDKEQRKLDRQQNPTSGNLDDMMAYVNEFGEIVSTPPDNYKKPE